MLGRFSLLVFRRRYVSPKGCRARKVWLGGYGGIIERDIGEEYIVDTGHLIAYDPSVDLKVALSGGIFSSLFSGEGFVSKMQGPGKIYMQTAIWTAWRRGPNVSHRSGTKLVLKIGEKRDKIMDIELLAQPASSSENYLRQW